MFKTPINNSNEFILSKIGVWYNAVLNDIDQDLQTSNNFVLSLYGNHLSILSATKWGMLFSAFGSMDETDWVKLTDNCTLGDS
jgi:hypothetical protein